MSEIQKYVYVIDFHFNNTSKLTCCKLLLLKRRTDKTKLSGEDLILRDKEEDCFKSCFIAFGFRQES